MAEVDSEGANCTPRAPGGQRFGAVLDIRVPAHFMDAIRPFRLLAANVLVAIHEAQHRMWASIPAGVRETVRASRSRRRPEPILTMWPAPAMTSWPTRSWTCSRGCTGSPVP